MAAKVIVVRVHRLVVFAVKATKVDAGVLDKPCIAFPKALDWPVSHVAADLPGGLAEEDDAGLKRYLFVQHEQCEVGEGGSIADAARVANVKGVILWAL